MLHNEARKLVLEAWDKTHNAREIAKYFSVNESTVYRLVEERARTGSYETSFMGFDPGTSRVGRVGAPLTVVHPSQNSGHAAFPHPALCETNRSHYHSYILTYIRGLTSE